jgi:hypothetical protein
MKRFLISALALGCAGGAAQAAQLVVLDAKGSIAATMPPGTVVDDATLDIPDHDQITVMSATGEAIQINGPHKGPVGAPSGGDPGMLDKLAQVMKERPASFGTTRGPHFPAAKDDPWAMHAELSGTACVFDGHAPQLYRSKIGDAVHVTVEDAGSHKTASFDWAADSAMAVWPADLPVVDGGHYTVSLGTDQATITLKKIGAAPTPGAASILAAGAGCGPQSRDLLKAVKPVRAAAQ